MGSHLTGVAVAICVVFGLYLTMHVPIADDLFAQDELGDHSVDQLLQTAVDRKSDDQVEAILMLGDRPGDLAKTVPVLAKLTMDFNELVKNAAHASLQKIGPPATEHIRQFLDARTTDNYKIACSAIRAIGPSCKIYMPEIRDLLLRDKAMERKCGLYALQGMESEALAALDEIIVCVADEDFNNQCSACRILEQLGPDAMEAEEALLKLLKEGNPSTRGWAAVCLGAIGPTTTNENVAELLAKNLSAVNPVERQRVLMGLAHLGPEAESVADQVSELLTTRDDFIKAHAAFTLWRITGNTDSTLKVLGDLIGSPGAAQDAIDLLGKMGGDALPLLNNIVVNLGSDDAGTRELAVIAIGNMGPKAASAAPKVRELLEDSDALVRVAARQTMELLEDKKSKKKAGGEKSK